MSWLSFTNKVWNTPSVSDTDKALQKPDKNTAGKKGGQTTLTTTAKGNNKPRHGTHANAKRSLKGNQRKKNHLNRSYDREDTTETVRRGLDLVERRFLTGKAYFELHCEENTPSGKENVFLPEETQNALSANENVFLPMEGQNTLSG